MTLGQYIQQYNAPDSFGKDSRSRSSDVLLTSSAFVLIVHISLTIIIIGKWFTDFAGMLTICHGKTIIICVSAVIFYCKANATWQAVNRAKICLVYTDHIFCA